MRPRTLIVMLVLVVGLGAFIWLVERELPSSDARRESAARVLDIDRDAVGELEIRAGDRETVLERAAGEWRLVEPFEARADVDLVESLLDTLEKLEKSRTLTDASEEAVGLAEPRGRVTMRSGGTTRSLLIGSDVPASSTMIVSLAASSGIFVVGTGLWEAIDREPGDWRSRELLTASRGEIEGVTLIEEDTRIGIRRHGETFLIDSSLTDRADEEWVGDLLNALLSLRVESFLDDPAADAAGLGLAPARRIVRVDVENREVPFELALGLPVEVAGETGGDLMWARVDGQIVQIRKDPLGSFGTSVDGWRSPAEVESPPLAAGEEVLGEGVDGAD